MSTATASVMPIDMLQALRVVDRWRGSPAPGPAASLLHGVASETLPPLGSYAWEPLASSTWTLQPPALDPETIPLHPPLPFFLNEGRSGEERRQGGGRGERSEFVERDIGGGRRGRGGTPPVRPAPGPIPKAHQAGRQVHGPSPRDSRIPNPRRGITPLRMTAGGGRLGHSEPWAITRRVYSPPPHGPSACEFRGRWCLLLSLIFRETWGIKYDPRSSVYFFRSPVRAIIRPWIQTPSIKRRPPRLWS